jgi:hypothetical protein
MECASFLVIVVIKNYTKGNNIRPEFFLGYFIKFLGGKNGSYN